MLTRFCILLIRNIIIIYLKTYILIEIYKSKSFKISFFSILEKHVLLILLQHYQARIQRGGGGAGAARPPLFVP